jgi:hypothetical protein
MVTRSPKVAYEVLSMSTLTLTCTAPSQPFRFKIVASSVVGHTNLVGTVSVGPETKTISGTTSVQTTIGLSSHPTITTSGLDCALSISYIDLQGQPIMTDTLTPIDTRIERYDSGFFDASCLWKKTSSVIYSDAHLDISDIVRSGSVDYRVGKVSEYKDLVGNIEFYCYLTT